VKRDLLTLIFYCAGSLCFLIGSALALAERVSK
jgi:hypothetical protein